MLQAAAEAKHQSDLASVNTEHQEALSQLAGTQVQLDDLTGNSQAAEIDYKHAVGLLSEKVELLEKQYLDECEHSRKINDTLTQTLVANEKLKEDLETTQDGQIKHDSEAQKKLGQALKHNSQLVEELEGIKTVSF